MKIYDDLTELDPKASTEYKPVCLCRLCMPNIKPRGVEIRIAHPISGDLRDEIIKDGGVLLPEEER